jgi:hypothetical protein
VTERVTRISYTIAYFSVLLFLIFLAKWNTKAMIFTGSVILISVAVIFICMLIDLLIQWKLGKELLKLFSGLLFIFIILYIFGQAGSMDLNRISIPQFIVRTSIGLVILAADTVLINYIQWKEGNG